MGLLRLLRVSAVPPAPPASDPTNGVFNLLPVFAAAELLQPHQHTLAQIRQQVGIPLVHWEALYGSLIQRFAGFVQQLPASEAHHHRERGGLLKHALETTHKALSLRRGVLLPQGASAEALAEKQDVWTYATASAALLHDLGKPLVDQKVMLFAAGRRPLGAWNPLAGPIPTAATHYSIQYVRGRRYRLHPRLPPMLAHHVVPALGLEWLAQDLDVFEAWLATISGGDPEFAGTLGQIVKQADSLSAAADLSGEPAAPVTAGRRPLAERMALALRKLVDDQALPLNRPGAAGFVFGDDLWLVSKRALDALRDAMTAEAPGGVPGRNERLMDELQQHGILMPNGDRAIWAATVELGDWRQALTLLRIPLARLWADPASRPAAAPGRVIVDTAGPSADAAPVPAPSPAPEIRGVDSEDLSPVVRESATAAPRLPLPPLADLSAPESTQPLSRSPTPGSGEPALAGASEAGNPASPSLAENEVIRWIVAGIGAGRLKLNTADARIHVTAEGLLLVSPGIFRDFAGPDGWLGSQKRLLKLKAHRKNADGTNIWTYRVVGERRSSALLKGVLVEKPEAQLGLRLPEPNPHLVLVAPENPKPVAIGDPAAP